ncbi:unnamed protein product [Phytophthora fragariaefolia]|uniref:Unnamed protein product n=1 Tax=Phytophthora fragariaefolia TaxID=1490495 RepID=A0A9W6XTV0_9STRA|nr:unnamed protein product [Phytophthora fragariaefolia]
MEAEANIAMAPGVFNILTVIEPDLVDPKGIAWVQHRIKQECIAKKIGYSRAQWRQFWVYFRKTWLERYFVTEWNVFGIANTVVARTNNPLERFNREMNAVFKPHPNLRHFVAIIAKISTSYAQRQASITRGLRRKKQCPPRIELPTAPDLSTFEVPPESDDDDYEDEEVVLDSCSDAESNESSNMDDSNEVLTSGNVETAENLAHNILENTDNHDFSLEWEGDESCSESSASDS